MSDIHIDLTPLPQDRKLKPQDRKIMAVARDFEALMIDQLFQTMRQTVNPTGLDGGSTMKTYQGMMDEKMASLMAHGQGLGLADMIARQLMGHDPETSTVKNLLKGE